MKNKLILLIGLGMSLSMALSAPFSPEEARRIFDESSSKISSSATQIGDYIFMEIKWDEDKSASEEDQEAQELAVLLAGMQKFITPEPQACTNSPFCKILTEWMEPHIEFNVPNVQRSVVKDELNGDQHRQLVAFDAKPLLDAKKEAKNSMPNTNSRTEEQWCELLREAAGNFKTADEKRKFRILLGCPVMNLIADKGAGEYGTCLPGCEHAWSEFEKIRDWKPIDGLFFSEYQNLLWTAYSNRKDTIYLPNWAEDDGGRFEDAEKLYRKGKDIPRIITLLAESISMNPISSKKWEYLGGVLNTLNKPDDALIAYIQALKISPKSSWAWKGLVDCLEKAGYKENAKGMKWYLKIMK